jgi:biopolymer transport protein ExbD
MHRVARATLNAPPPRHQATHPRNLPPAPQRGQYCAWRAITQDVVESELKALKLQHPDLTLHLQADEGVPYGTVAKVMASIERSGMSRLSVLTNPN